MKLEVEPSRWDELLAVRGCTDVYYLRGYLDSVTAIQPGRSAFLYLEAEEGFVVFPCAIRDQPGLGVRDATTVGYGGPLALGADPPVERFFELYEEWCAEQAIVTTFVRFHPLLANHSYAGPNFQREQVEGTVCWPLVGDLFAGMHRHHRRLVRKSEAVGVSVHVEIGPGQLDGFAALYEQTMARLGASTFHFFPEEYWRRLAQELGDRVILLEARLDGRTLGSVLCLATPPWLHYHLGATSDEARRLGVSHLLLYSAARFGAAHGYEQFHLGSGVGAGGGSLLEFKQRFSPAALLQQWFGKAVHDVDRYLKLTGTEAVAYDGFFPAYRR